MDHRQENRRAARVSARAAAASDDWMMQQQARAEAEADAWRQLREESSAAAQSGGAPSGAAVARRHSGGAKLEALVCVGLATFGAHFGWLAASAFRLGEFEVWLAMAAGFAVTLSLSVMGLARGLVRLLADAARWAVVWVVALSGVWLLFQFLK